MRTYDRVKILLEQSVDCRNSDKILIWAFWRAEGKLAAGGSLFDQGYTLSENNFMSATAPESIIRARRKVQELYPNLRATETVKAKRRGIEKTKGTFIYN